MEKLFNLGRWSTYACVSNVKRASMTVLRVPTMGTKQIKTRRRGAPFFRTKKGRKTNCKIEERHLLNSEERGKASFIKVRIEGTRMKANS